MQDVIPRLGFVGGHVVPPDVIRIVLEQGFHRCNQVGTVGRVTSWSPHARWQSSFQSTLNKVVSPLIHCVRYLVDTPSRPIHLRGC